MLKRIRRSWRRFLAELDSRLNLGYLRYQLFEEPRQLRAWVRARRKLSPSARFSVVMPTYGISLVYLREAVRSVFAQTYGRWELCICDDGDPDPGVRKYLERLRRRHPDRVRLARHDRNGGICAATRTAIGLAAGDYLVFMDADDRLHRRALQLFATRIAEAPEADFLYSNHDYMTEWGLRKHPTVKPGWSPELLLHVNYINHLNVVRTELLKRRPDLFSDEFSGAQDWDLCLAVVAEARRVCHLPQFLYHWRARPGSMADDSAAKPWAILAQAKVRQRHVKALAPDLTFDFSRNRPAFENEDMALERIEISLKACSGLAQRDVLRQLRNEVSWRVALGAVCTLSDGSRPPLEGDAASLAAYTRLPRTGAVWPFLRAGLRTAYTLGREAGELRRLQSARSSFSYFPGNVLTGPLHGLTASAEVLLKGINALLEAADDSFLGAPANLDQVGAQLGLQLIALGRRNLSVNGAVCAQEFEPVRVSDRLIPQVDPYI